MTYGQVLTIVYMDLRPTRTYCFCVVKISYNEMLSAERCPYISGDIPNAGTEGQEVMLFNVSIDYCCTRKSKI